MSVSGELPHRTIRISRAAQAAHPAGIQSSQHLIGIKLPSGLPEPDLIYDELEHYCQVLLGHTPSPVQSPYLELAEVATAYLGRAYELDMLIHRREAEGNEVRGGDYYRLRTGALRSFIDMARRMADLGSRRLTQETLVTQQRRDSGEADY